MMILKNREARYSLIILVYGKELRIFGYLLLPEARYFKAAADSEKWGFWTLSRTLSRHSYKKKGG